MYNWNLEEKDERRWSPTERERPDEDWIPFVQEKEIKKTYNFVIILPYITCSDLKSLMGIYNQGIFQQQVNSHKWLWVFFFGAS